MGSQSIRGSDHDVINGSGNEKKSESFVVDFENFGYGLIDKDSATTATHNSKIITLQRSLSRKGTPSRTVDRKSERENSCLLAAASSPTAAKLGSGTPEKPGSALTSPPREEASTMGATTEHQHHHSVSVNPLAPQHQIAIKSGGSGTINAAGPPNPVEKKRWGRRSYSFRRSSYSWFSDPKRILLLFATLSSVGTMLLIYFTLTLSKSSGENNDPDRLPPQL